MLLNVSKLYKNGLSPKNHIFYFISNICARGEHVIIERPGRRTCPNHCIQHFLHAVDPWSARAKESFLMGSQERIINKHNKFQREIQEYVERVFDQRS